MYGIKRKNKLCLSAELGGGRWIRTTEGIASRFTVCPLWPLGNSPMFNWSWWTDSNPRPADYKSAALPTELHQHLQGQQPSSSRSDIIAETPSFVNSFFITFSILPVPPFPAGFRIRGSCPVPGYSHIQIPSRQVRGFPRWSGSCYLPLP